MGRKDIINLRRPLVLDVEKGSRKSAKSAPFVYSICR